MKVLLIGMMAFGSLLAENPPAPAPAPQKTDVSLDGDEQKTRVMLDTTQQNLNLEYEQLRMKACWRSGLRPEECGQWSSASTIKILKAQSAVVPPGTPAPTPAAAPTSSK